jgi:hypothetical protein
VHSGFQSLRQLPDIRTPQRQSQSIAVTPWNQTPSVFCSVHSSFTRLEQLSRLGSPIQIPQHLPQRIFRNTSHHSTSSAPKTLPPNIHPFNHTHKYPHTHTNTTQTSNVSLPAFLSVLLHWPARLCLLSKHSRQQDYYLNGHRSQLIEK